MTRLVIALASAAFGSIVALGCGGSAKQDTTTTAGSGAGSNEPAHLVKKVQVSWGISPVGPTQEMADVFLATTDETGKQVSHSIGRYKGTCSVFSPAADMNAITGVQCKAGGGGTELHLVVQGGEHLIVLQMPFTEGAPQDAMNRKEITRVKVSRGIGIEVDPVQATTGAP
ncbi:MAG: hypothetical protein H0T42_08960 [Deltaproteobacteria bacterium]|nr:hypothetical protein [Deltaproteobacteria bacterium]